MTRKFCQGANLLALMADRRVPSWLAPIVTRVQKFITTRSYGGTLLDEAKGPLGWSVVQPKSFKKEKFTVSEKQLLDEFGIRRAQACTKVVRDGLEVYQGASTSAANSGISYHSPRYGKVSSGRITRIVKQAEANDAGRIYLLVQPFRPLSAYDAQRDPFRRYPEFQAELVYATPSLTCEVISLHDVVGHVALCPFDGRLGRQSVEPCLISLSLSRVCAFHFEEYAVTDAEVFSPIAVGSQQPLQCVLLDRRLSPPFTIIIFFLAHEGNPLGEGLQLVRL